MLSDVFVRKVSAYIAGNALLSGDGIHVVALSGGADSVALVLVLRQLGYRVEAVHCNFHLRGDESDRDEAFCRQFCADNGIPLHVAHFDTREFAVLRKISIEMAARDLRYSYFKNLATDLGASSVCVAHHRDDSVETVLMNLIRGTGVHGLTGIQPRNGLVARPLLCVGRNEIEGELHRMGQKYVTDSTNLVDDVVRNKIRLDLIPLMRQINPSVSDSIAKTAERIAEVAKVFDAAIGQSVTRVVKSAGASDALYNKASSKEIPFTIDLNALKDEPSPEYTLFYILRDYSFTPSQVEQISRSVSEDPEPGRVFYSSTHQLLIDRDCIVVEPLDTGDDKPMFVPECGIYIYGGTTKFRFECVERDGGFVLDKDVNCCQADLSAVEFPLVIRRAVQGDRFVPFGMKSSKLVSDFLTDRKLNLFAKRRQLLVADAQGNVLWIVGQRTDNRCRINPDTKTVLKITLD